MKTEDERYVNATKYRVDREARLIPSIIQIEPIFGCNADCIMCVVNKPTKRQKGAMPMDLFRKVVDDLVPYRDQIVQVDLFGLGEPLLDKNVFERIRYTKEKGLKGIGISTNADLMNDAMQKELLESGVDTVILSIDSLQKDIHEKIRVNTTFETVIQNTNDLIKKRNEGNYKTKLVFRFISQPLNEGGWEEFKSYWDERIDRSRGDQINSYNVHSWVGEADVETGEKQLSIEELECYQVFDRVFILADGTMSMCSCDLHHPYVPIGNVKEMNLIDLYNSDKMREIRDTHVAGKKNTIDTCSKCVMLYSKEKKEVF